MVCEEPVRAAIWHTLNHYFYDDAIFLAERLYAEVGSDEALYLLATCYYRANKPKKTYSLLQCKGCPTPQCKFLFARCCLDLDKHAEIEMSLSGGESFQSSKVLETIATEFGTAASYSLALMGHVYRKSEQCSKAVECFKSSLKYNPFLWKSFEYLCKLGEKPNSSDYFKTTTCPKFYSSTKEANTAVIPVDTSHHDSSFKLESKSASENMDPSQNPDTPTSGNVFITSAPVSSMNKSSSENLGFMVSTPMGSVRHPQRTGRNLLNMVVSPNPLTPSFGVVQDGTPHGDIETGPFITPSPTAVSHDHVVLKAPIKKTTIRRDGITSKVVPFSNFESSSQKPMSSLSNAPFTPSPLSISQSSISSTTTVRRSSRLFDMNLSVASTETKKSKSNSKLSISKAGLAPRKAKPRRTSRPSPPQPLSPCIENVMQEISQSHTGNGQQEIIKTSVASHSAEGLMTLLREIGQAYALLSAFECKKALTLFNQLPPHQLNTAWVLTQVGRAHFELAQYHEAEKVFSDVRRLDPCHVEGMEIFSTTLWHLQKEVALSSLAQELVDTDPDSPQTWCVTGNCFSLQKEHDAAIKFFQRAVQVDPTFAYAYTLLGHEYVLTEELDRGMSCFRSAIIHDPRHYNAWYGVGLIYYKQEKFDLAEVHFKKALVINPSSSVLYCHVGVTLHAMKKSDAAISTINKAISIDPRNPLCKFHRASILFSMKEYKDALKELEELKKIVPREALVYFLLGKVYKKMRQPHLAQMNFSWAIDLDPKGANNQIKEAIDKRYLPDDDDNTVGLGPRGGVDVTASLLSDHDSEESDMELEASAEDVLNT